MGRNTELLLKINIKKDIPEEVKDILNYLFNEQEYPILVPDHPFFFTSRWDMVGRCSSYYHIPWATSKYDEDVIFSRSDLKDYDEEIELFLDWIDPHLDEIRGGCIGYKWYEEDQMPTLLFKK